jgi:hypothetical protein
MKIRRSITAAAAAAVLGGTAALVLPAVASAHSATTTLKFTATEHKTISWLPINSFIFHETDTNSRGRTIGFDDIYFTNQTCCSVTADVTFALRGGLLYGTFDASGDPTLSITNGKVTGGTGAFNGVTGTITGAPTDTLTKIQFTITYS